MEPVRFAVIGVGGFGIQHWEAVLKAQEEGAVRLVAFVARSREKYKETVEKLEAQGAKWFSDYREMLAASDLGIEVVTIAAGHHMHEEMTVAACEAGCHVLVEKPASTSVQSVDRMIAAAEQHDRRVQVSYQWMSNTAAHRLKRAIIDGELGELKDIVGIGKAFRYDAYYARNHWAGKVLEGDTLILDGPMCNPFNHIINISLYFGSRQPQHAVPVSLRAERYRARDIEGEDTGCVVTTLENGCRAFFYTTLCDANPGFVMRLQVFGTNGTATWNDSSLTIEREGKVVEQMEAEGSTVYDMVMNIARAARGQAEVLCPLTEARKVVTVNNGLFESCPVARPIPPKYVRREDREDSVATLIDGIGDLIVAAAEKRQLLSEAGAPWGHATPEVSLKDYRGLTAARLRELIASANG